MKIKISIIKELENAADPNNIRVGYTREMFVNEKTFKTPIVGENFPRDNHWQTSTVHEIIDDRTFRTLNYIWVWEIIEEEQK